MHTNAHLQSAWNRDGERAFVFEIKEVVVEYDRLIGREQFWLDCIFQSGHTYNFVETAGGSSWGTIRSEEHCRNISRAKMGHEVSKTTRQKLREANVGKECSDATKRKIGKALTGRDRSETHRQNLSKSLKGRELTEVQLGNLRRIHEANRGSKYSDEHRRRISTGVKKYYSGLREAGITTRRQPMTEETKQKISMALKGTKRSEEFKQKIRESWKVRRVQVEEVSV